MFEAESIYQIISLDLPPLVALLCSSIACALLGNFLVLRRMSLMGDAISHAVLPGIVIAFLVSSSRNTVPVLIGATLAGVLTTVLVELVSRLGKVEKSAAMGVVFAVLFAVGVVLIEQAAARHVDLDADCLLHGQLESIFWYPPSELSELFSLTTLSLVPTEVVSSAAVMILVLLFVAIFYKELAISSFDPGLSDSLGFSTTLLHYLLMVFVAVAVVGSFSAVGSILVIAMIICPAAIARLLTDNLATQLWLSVLIACLAGFLGYVFAAIGPFWIGLSSAVNAAGMIATVLGLFLAVAALFAPKYGLLSKYVRDLKINVQIAAEDLLGLLFRIEEGSLPALSYQTLSADKQGRKFRDSLSQNLALRQLFGQQAVKKRDNTLSLTEIGRDRAQLLVRTHRLWESYLVEQLGLRPDHVHDTAMDLEHYTSEKLGERLADLQEHAAQDPHGRPIPKSD